jgi:hypothetical protein
VTPGRYRRQFHGADRESISQADSSRRKKRRLSNSER